MTKACKWIQQVRIFINILIDESINIDPGSESDEEDNNEDSILDKMLSPARQNKSIFQAPQKMNLKNAKDSKREVPSKTIDLVKNMNTMIQVSSTKQPAKEPEKEKENPFKAKKTGFATTLSKAFKNLF